MVPEDDNDVDVTLRWKKVWLFAIVWILILVGTGSMMVLEKLTFPQALYWAFQTTATIGGFKTLPQMLRLIKKKNQQAGREISAMTSLVVLAFIWQATGTFPSLIVGQDTLLVYILLYRLEC